MRVLYATPRPPWPPHEGDQVIAWEQLRRLGGRCELSLLTLDTELEDEGALRRALAPHCREVHVLRGGRDRRRALRTLWNGLPMLVNLYWDRSLARQVDEVVRRLQPDLVHAQTIHMAEYFRDLALPRTIDLVDPLSLNVRRRAELARLPRSLVYRAEAELLRRYEERVLPGWSRVIVVSLDDVSPRPGVALRGNPQGTHVTPELLAAHPAPEPRELALVFHGTMRYYSNVDAAVWFAREPFPRLRERHPGLQLYLVGRNPVPEVRALEGPGVVVTGAVDDVIPYLRRVQVGVYPLRAGTGIKFKVIEALACGLPCVLSPTALQGFDQVRAPEHVLVASDADAWVEQVDRLLRDADLRERLGRAGQAAIEGHYSWERNAERLLEVWEEAVSRP